MRRHEALDAAKEECRKAGKTYKLAPAKGSHWKMFIDGVKRVLIISNTIAVDRVRNDVRKAIGGR
jgi:predicted secreted Zn-dependent protease